MPELVAFGETMLRLNPPAGERLETATSLEFRTAGAESNVAVTASRLGVEATWLSKLPDSPLGRKVVGDLRRHGVDTEVVWSEDARQGTYYLEFGDAPRGTNVIYDRDSAAITTATPNELPLEYPRSANMCYISGITPALSPQLRKTVSELMDIAVENRTTTAFDLNYRSKLWSPEEAQSCFEKLLPRIDILIVAERDARGVLNRTEPAPEIAKRLKEEYEIDIVVITRGSDGALAVSEDELYRQEAYETETYDAVGTGDAFVGAFLAQLLASSSIPQALEYAAATSSLKRTISGDIAVITSQDVEELIKGQDDSIAR